VVQEDAAERRDELPRRAPGRAGEGQQQGG
jgi:hypothetical protein